MTDTNRERAEKPYKVEHKAGAGLCIDGPWPNCTGVSINWTSAYKAMDADEYCSSLNAAYAAGHAAALAVREGHGLEAQWERQAQELIAEASRIRSVAKVPTDAEERCVVRAEMLRKCAKELALAAKGTP